MNNLNTSMVLKIVVGLVVVSGIGAVGWKAISPPQNKGNDPGYTVGKPTEDDIASQQIAKQETTTTTETTVDTSAVWDNNPDSGWKLIYGTAPKCRDPYTIKPPTDVTKATALLYPGQTRQITAGESSFSGKGLNYKPHGGFRFDGIKNDAVSVVSPIDGYLYRGTRFLVGGEVQYSFDIIDSCGMMVRLGHLLTLTDRFQKIADTFPPAAEGDSRTEKVEKGIIVKAGEPMATAVGLTKNSNTGFDLGVYDLRQPNGISKTTAYQTAHADDKELAWHAVCWFDMLPKADATFLKNLPAGDPTSGKKSDYCI
jgi:hypothetical protein